jgi:hypothetical protein
MLNELLKTILRSKLLDLHLLLLLLPTIAAVNIKAQVDVSAKNMLL